ncbi:hypothetical protein TorRG33x02_035560 [Trema orientale]|uniref:Uncharacterized protein n=1 Tax=Trema orientale TaxID=63057 RepID=A0A2P5FRU3_TREOI|nr:hypothetical protein TorRG33x02_035560 [Trema orientale]
MGFLKHKFMKDQRTLFMELLVFEPLEQCRFMVICPINQS